MGTTYAKIIDLGDRKPKFSDEEKKANMSELKRMWKDESRIVKGRFLCFEPIGGSVTFVFRKYPWDQATEYTFIDDKEYDIPLAVARHLNGIDITAKKIDGKIHTCSYPVHQYKKQKDSDVPAPDIGKYTRRFAFQTLEGQTAM